MNDVDLVFANAMQFNEEHSLIWEDAKALQVCVTPLSTGSLNKSNEPGIFPSNNE